MTTDHPTDNAPPKIRLTDWTNEPTLAQLKRDHQDAQVETSQHNENIDRWLDNLNITGTAKLPKQKNRSSVQPKLIRKQAEWRYSSLSEPFLSTPDIFNVSPVTYEDRRAAQQNELVLNHQFNNQLNKVKLIDDYIHTAVDEGTVIVRVGWELEEEEVTKEVPVFAEQSLDPYDPSHNQFVQQLQELMSLAQADPEAFEAAPEEMKRSVQRTMELGYPIEVYISEYKTVTENKVVKNQPTAEVCDYNDVVVDPSCKGDAEKAKFIVYRFTTSLEELRSAGLYENLDSIQVTNNSPLAQADENDPDNMSFNFKDEPRKKFYAYEYWGYWDIHGNGTVKPIVATYVGDTLIRMEENPFPDKKIPFVIVPYLPVKNSLYGEPDGELIKDNQDIVGAVTRGMIDILAQ